MNLYVSVEDESAEVKRKVRKDAHETINKQSVSKEYDAAVADHFAYPVCNRNRFANSFNPRCDVHV